MTMDTKIFTFTLLFKNYLQSIIFNLYYILMNPIFPQNLLPAVDLYWIFLRRFDINGLVIFDRTVRKMKNSRFKRRIRRFLDGLVPKEYLYENGFTRRKYNRKTRERNRPLFDKEFSLFENYLTHLSYLTAIKDDVHIKYEPEWIINSLKLFKLI